VRVGFLAGDVNRNRSITAADTALINNGLAQLLSPSNFLLDVNLSGSISLSDLLLVRTNLSKLLPAP